jgi:hypothetical protein
MTCTNTLTCFHVTAQTHIFMLLKIGVALSLSTMAAAALGNILSDVFGISASDQIEVLITLLAYVHVFLVKPSFQLITFITKK